MLDRRLIVIGIVLLGLVIVGVIISRRKTNNPPHPPISCNPPCSADQQCLNGECKCKCGPDDYCDLSVQHCFPRSRCGDKKLPENPSPGCTLDNLICPADTDPNLPTTWRCPTVCDSRKIPYPAYKDGCTFEELICLDENGWRCPSNKNTYCHNQGTRTLKDPDTPCTCNQHYNGPTCNCSRQDTCNNHGDPINESCVCQCDGTYYGTSCDKQCGDHTHPAPTPGVDCHGQPETYNCACDSSEYTRLCGTESCYSPGDCCGSGHREHASDPCICNTGYILKPGDPSCCVAQCKNGGKPITGGCDCSTATKRTSDSITDCDKNTIYKVTYFTDSVCGTEVDCYNGIGDDNLGLDKDNHCICPKGACGDDCKMNDLSCNCNGSPCGSTNLSSCVCNPGYEGDTCLCHKPAICDVNHGSNLPVEKAMCQDFKMLACTDTKRVVPCKEGGNVVDHYCEIDPTNCDDWQAQMNYIGGIIKDTCPTTGKAPYSCAEECSAQGGDVTWGDVHCIGAPPKIVCQEQCLDSTDSRVATACGKCNKDTDWCICDGVGNDTGTRKPYEWGCDSIYDHIDPFNSCIDREKEPTSCCDVLPVPQYLHDHCTAPGAMHCVDCGANPDGSGYGMIFYCTKLSKMPVNCAIHKGKISTKDYTDKSTGETYTIYRAGSGAPVYPIVDNDQCLAGGGTNQISDGLDILATGEEFWDLFDNQKIPGNIIGNGTTDSSYVPLKIDSNNVYYTYESGEDNFLCLTPNTCKNGGNFNSKVTYKAGGEGYLKDCNKGICTLNSKFQLYTDTISKEGVCSCPDGTVGPLCQFTRKDTCSDHGTPDYNGNCTCDSLFYSGNSCQVQCNGNGSINGDRCQCDYRQGYTGKYCDVKALTSYNSTKYTGIDNDPGVFVIESPDNAENVRHIVNALGDDIGTLSRFGNDWTFTSKFNPGNVFFSGFGNTLSWTYFGKQPVEFTWTSPKDCSGNGTVVGGNCKCFPTFFSEDYCANGLPGVYNVIVNFSDSQNRYLLYDHDGNKTFSGPRGPNMLALSFEKSVNNDNLIISWTDPSTNTKKYLAKGSSQPGYWLWQQLASAVTDPKMASEFSIGPQTTGFRYTLQYLGGSNIYLSNPGGNNIDFTVFTSALPISIAFEPVSFFYITIPSEPLQTSYVSYNPNAKPNTYKGPRSDYALVISLEHNTKGNMIIAVNPGTSNKKYLAPDPSFSGWESYWLGNQIQSGVTDPDKATEFNLTEINGGYYFLYCLGIPNLVLCTLGDGNMDVDFADYYQYNHIAIQLEPL